MVTPTNNPVPSQAPQDLLFNAERLDEVLNSTAETIFDRNGTQRRTLAGLSAEFPNAQANAAQAASSAAAAGQSAGIAGASRVAAESARDAAYALINVADSFAEGVARSAATTGTAAFFAVRKGGAGPGGSGPLARTTLYQRTGTSTAAQFDAVASADDVAFALGDHIQPGATWDKAPYLRAMIVGMDLSALTSYDPSRYYSFAIGNVVADRIQLDLYSAGSSGGAGYSYVGTFSKRLDMRLREVVVLDGTGALTGCSIAILPCAWPVASYGGFSNVPYDAAGIASTAFVARAKAAVTAVRPDGLPMITLPSRLHLRVGQQFSLYYDAFALMPDVGAGNPPMMFDVFCDFGGMQRRAWQVTPQSWHVGDHDMLVMIYDRTGTTLDWAYTTVTVLPATNPGSATNVLVIGDSTKDDTNELITALQAELATYGGNVPTFRGTHGSGAARHEARSGNAFRDFTDGSQRYKFTLTGVPPELASNPGLRLTAADGSGLFVLNEERQLDGSGNGWIIGNVWVQPSSGPVTNGWTGAFAGGITVTNTQILPTYSILFDSGGVGALSFGAYASRFGIPTIDLLVVDLGINDCRNTGALLTTAQVDAIVARAKALFASYFAYNGSGRGLLCLPKSGASTRDLSGAKHDFYRANIHRLRAAFIAAFDPTVGGWDARLHLAATGLTIDRYYGYPLGTATAAAAYTETEVVHTDKVHPRSQGYVQEAAAFDAAIGYALMH